MLETLGLDRHTVEVYRAMLTRREWGVTEIADHLGLDVVAVRRALDRLVELDLLRNSWERPGHWRPVNPDVGLSALVSREQAELARRQEEIERTRKQISDLVSELTQASKATTIDIELLEGMDAVRGRLESLARETVKEGLAFTPGGAASAESLEAAGPLDEAALARGVQLRTLYLSSIANDVGTRRYVHWLAGLGGESRTVPALPLRMFIADREIALIPIDPANSRAGALLIRSPGMLTALCALFEAYWQVGEPFGVAAARTDDAPSAQELEILRQLAAGAKDETIARVLGVSLRTARRNVAELMARLDASSRFQAGAQAVRRGWI